MCTHITLKNNRGNIITARTIGFSIKKPEIFLVPRKYSIKFTRFKALHYHHGFIGLGKKEADYIFLDGVNEKGLSCSSLLSEEFEDYRLKGSRKKINLAPGELVKWILSNYKDVMELIDDLKNLNIVFKNYRKAILFHWIVTDSSGNSIILQAKSDGFKIYKNNLGPLSNGPNISWQYVNLKRITGVFIFEYKNKYMEKIYVSSFGEDEMFDDYNSYQSRFIKAVVSENSIANLETYHDSLKMVKSLLNSLRFSNNARGENSKNKEMNYSLYISLDKLTLYFNFSDYHKPHKVDLKMIDLNSYKMLIFDKNKGI